MYLPDGVRRILETIVNEMGECQDGQCNCHAVRFGHDDLVVAREALAHKAINDQPRTAEGRALAYAERPGPH